MLSFKNLSLRRKQMLIILLTTSVALLLAGAAFTGYEVITFRSTMKQNIATLADIVDHNTAAALDFNDPKSAAETLSALQAEPSIIGAWLYAKDGQPFAKYDRANDNIIFTPPTILPNGTIFQGHRLILCRPVIIKGEALGTLYLETDMRALSSRLKRYAWIVGMVLLASLLLAFMLSSKLQRLVSDPILQLAKVARSVALEKNYSVRAEKQSNDELGQLVDGFNEMLEQIQERDSALQKNHVELEWRVEERTLELASSLSLVRATLESTSDGILVIDAAGAVVNFNEQFVNMWGIPQPMRAAKVSREMMAFMWPLLKDPKAFLANIKEMEVRTEAESFDLLELHDGRFFERSSKPQRIGDKSVGRVWSFRDITERKHSEIILRKTEELYRQAISGAGAVPYSYDYRSQSYSFMGEGIEQLIGYPAKEISSALWTRISKESIMMGETAGLDKQEAAKRVKSGEIQHWRCDMRVATRDGKSRWISDTSVQTLNEAGEITGSMGILEDVTDRKQAEINAVAFSRLSQSLISATTPQAVSNIVSVVADELFGWDAYTFYPCYEDANESFPGIFIDTINGERIIVPSPSSNFKLSSTDRRVLANGAELILKKDILNREQEAVPYGDQSRPSASIMRVPVRIRTKVTALLSIHSYTLGAYSGNDLNTLQTLADYCGAALERIWADKTLRQSESQFRLVWDSSEDGMRLADREGAIVMVNEAYCRMVQKTKAELEGQALSVIHNEEGCERVLSEHRKQIDSNAIETHLEKEVILWNGGKIWLEWSNSMLELPGRPRLLLSIFRDIGQRKKSEAELENMHKQLLSTSRQAGMAEVATSVLHNVGNVLNSVNISCSLVSDKVRKSKVINLAKAVGLITAHATDLPDFFARDPKGLQLPSYLSSLAVHLADDNEEILQELVSLTGNIEHIKEIVAMQQSYARISGVLESLNVADLVEDALRMNAGAMERHQVHVIREYGEGLPKVMVDKHKVLQILVNLIRNAKYAMDDAMPAEKRLTLRINAKGEEKVKISVIDNGIGIPAENLTRIFAHGFTTRKEGHGFGLHSGALAAKELGGSLMVHSDGPGKGATFTLELPSQSAKEEIYE